MYDFLLLFMIFIGVCISLTFKLKQKNSGALTVPQTERKLVFVSHDLFACSEA